MLLKNRFVPILLVLLIFGVGIYLAYIYTFSERAGQETSSERNGASSLSEASKAAVDAYLRGHISELSTEPEVLGGKFYVTDIAFLSDTRARVWYEDGHNAFKAEFDFFINADNEVREVNFRVIQRN